MSKFLYDKLEEIKKDYTLHYEELEKCFVKNDSSSFDGSFEELEASFNKTFVSSSVKEYPFFSIAAHYVMLVSFLEGGFK
jgi:hypothetical protein